MRELPDFIDIKVFTDRTDTSGKELSEISKKEKEIIGKKVAFLEVVLEGLGMNAQVIEVNYLKDTVQYCLELGLGTKVTEILAVEKDIALALASPCGKVTIEAPIPGRRLIGVLVSIENGQVREPEAYPEEYNKVVKRLETQRSKVIPKMLNWLASKITFVADRW